MRQEQMMFWFKLRRASNVVDSNLGIEGVKSEEREKHVQEGTLGTDGTLEIDKTHSSEGSDA